MDDRDESKDVLIGKDSDGFPWSVLKANASADIVCGWSRHWDGNVERYVPFSELTQLRAAHDAANEELPCLVSSLGAGCLGEERTIAQYIDRVKWGIEHQASVTAQAFADIAQLRERLSRVESTASDLLEAIMDHVTYEVRGDTGCYETTDDPYVCVTSIHSKITALRSALSPEAKEPHCLRRLTECELVNTPPLTREAVTEALRAGETEARAFAEHASFGRDKEQTKP